MKKQQENKPFMKIMGNRKMTAQMIKDANAIKKARITGEWSQIVNYCLPVITDPDAPAEY